MRDIITQLSFGFENELIERAQNSNTKVYVSYNVFTETVVVMQNLYEIREDLKTKDIDWLSLIATYMKKYLRATERQVEVIRDISKNYGNKVE